MASLPSIVSTEWLAEHLGEPDLVVLDASWYLPALQRNAVAEYAAGHIPGALYFDLDANSDTASPLPHMLPSAEVFGERMTALGIRNGDRIVVYDGSGNNLSAPRAWWMFRAFGHEAVRVLDGGIGKWRRDGWALEAGPVTRAGGSFRAMLTPVLVRDLAAMRCNVERGDEQVLDARAAGRFRGTEPEPRAGLRSGHIPGSLNIPYGELVAADGTMLPRERLLVLFRGAGVDLARPIVTTCGSGVTACALAHALHLLGHDRVAVYDGSWTEWGGRSDTPTGLGAP